MQRIRDVYFFTDALLQEFQAHPGNDGKTSKFEPVLRKDRAVPRFTGVQITKLTMLRIRRFTSLIATILQRMIKIDTGGNGRNIAEQIVVVPHPRIEALRVISPQLN